MPYVLGLLRYVRRYSRTDEKDRTDEEKRFGIQLDSLSDIVCFGVLPFVIGVCIGARNGGR